MNLLKLFLTPLLLMLLFLPGCESSPELKDGYQFGDLSKIALADIQKVKQARNVYCADASTRVLRKAAVITIQSYLPAYPADGICTRLDSILINQIANKNNIRDGP